MLKRRKWKRWVVIGKLSLQELADVARANNMRIICGFTVGGCVHYQIGLYGTSDQMKQTQKRWIDNGHEVVNRQPSYAFSCDVDKPEADWVDKPDIELREV